MNERLKQIRTYLKFTQTELACSLEVPLATIQSYEYGRRTPPTSFIKLLCNKYCISEEWLLTGKGEMLQPMDRETEIAKMVTDLYHENDSFKEELCKLIVSMTPDQIDVLKLVARKLLKENHPSD